MPALVIVRDPEVLEGSVVSSVGDYERRPLQECLNYKS